MQNIEHTPEINISFLSSENPWQVVDATNQELYEQKDFSQRQLIGWLTLPLASQVINEYITGPLVNEGLTEGLRVIPNEMHQDRLDTDIAKAQKATKTGNASPPFVHIAIDPESAHELKLFVPSAQNRYRHLIMNVRGKLTIRGSANLDAVQNPNRQVSIFADANKKLTKVSLSETLKIPGNNSYAVSAPDCNLPKNSQSTFNRVRQYGGIGGLKI